MKKRISQRDIGRILGVNVSTVSRALRGLDGVSPALRQKIMDLADERGYHPNPFATSLRFDTTHTIGIVVPDVSFSHYSHIVKYIEGEARRAGYMSIITDSSDKYENEVDCVEHLLNMHVEGIVICLSQETMDKIEKLFKEFRQNIIISAAKNLKLTQEMSCCARYDKGRGEFGQCCVIVSLWWS